MLYQAYAVSTTVEDSRWRRVDGCGGGHGALVQAPGVLAEHAAAEEALEMVPVEPGY